jgi:diguanylate cyclase (GGDEF)-like protein
MQALISPDHWTIGEAQRLTALYQWQILDTAAEPEFDALARMAAMALGTSRAYVALLDAQRVWVKARHGWTIQSWPRLEDACVAQLPPDGEPRVLIARPDGPPMWPFFNGDEPAQFVAAAAIADDQGHSLGWIAVLDSNPRDAALSTEHAQALRDIALLARAALTARAHREPMGASAERLATAAQFRAALDVELRHAMRTGEPFTALRLDLDGLDAVRHGFGDAAANEVLMEVTRRLFPQVRMGDVLARVKAEGFGILMRHGGEESAEVLAARIVAAVEQPFTLTSGDTVGVAVSVGLAAYDDTVGSVSELLDRAEEALAEAHEENKQHWKLFDVLQQRSHHMRAQKQEG